MKPETPNQKPQTALCAALYVHIPFCRARCAYCDFNTYAGLDDLIPAYVAAVCREIEGTGERWGRLAVPTVFFGGGTPSLLPLDLVEKLFRVSRLTFDVSRDVEITLEANPGTVTPAYLRGLRALGVNRLSLGVQSAHAEELRLLGRIHTWAQAVESVAWAREAGFENLNLDLIFGLPAQTPARWRETLEAALALEPEHLSLYDLSVEEGTVLAEQIARGKLPAPDEDLAAEMYELAEEMLAEAGFFHYEISNWAKADTNVCRHNLVYWRNEPWLGVGAGAHSWLEGRRWANARHPREYIAAMEAGGTPVAEVEEIDQQMEMGETMMLGLRLAEGVSDGRFRARFGARLEKVFHDELVELQSLGLLAWDGCVACLTPRGRLLGNQVFARFV
jgi:oxygen-independent coproporphyrinogen-3 oxidase